MDVTLSYLTLAGAKYDSPPQNGIIERMQAAAVAGFRSLGAKLDEADQASMAALYGKVPELEWIDLDKPPDIPALELARDSFGATRVNAGVCQPGHVSWHDVITNLRAIADTGLSVAFEPVAFGSLKHTRTVTEIIKIADRENIGLLYDLWHVYMDNQAAPDEIDLIPPRLISEIQICGVPLKRPGKSHLLAASQNRPLISQSPVNVIRWLRDLREHGVTAPVSYECPHTPKRVPTCQQRAYTARHDIEYLERG